MLKEVIYDSLKACYVLINYTNANFGVNWFKGVPKFLEFMKEYRTYKRFGRNPNFKISVGFWYPQLLDRTGRTPIEPVYFYQDTWAAGKIFQLKPSRHYDIGSAVTTVGIISQFVPTTMVDIRPIEVDLQNLNFIAGSILDLPFEDNSIESLSSLCVVEHIGLGRYGDPLDPWGSEKAIEELKRVLKPEGNLLFSVPIDSECRIYFNAHRSFTREYILELFKRFHMIEEKYVYGSSLEDSYDRYRGFGTGLFHFRKERE